MKNCKQAFKPFYGETHSLGPETEAAMEAMAYSEALLYFRAFSSGGTASIVRKHMEGGN